MKKYMRNFLLLILITMCLNTVSTAYSRVDSVGIMVDTLGKIIILHEVEKGETFYSIARIYQIEPKRLIEFNKRNKIFLDIGDTIKVPTRKSLTIPGSKNSTEKKLANEKIKNSDALFHTVGVGDNLYRISIKYGTTVEELKRINGLSSNSLSLGQQILIKSAGGQENNTTINTTENNEEEEEEIDRGVTFGNIRPVTESGVGGWINSKYLDPKKSLALHKTAPIGTVIKVTNKMNNKSIYVKVIGVLPDTDENKNTMILISRTAKEVLGVIDERFQCTLQYSVSKQ